MLRMGYHKRAFWYTNAGPACNQSCSSEYCGSVLKLEDRTCVLRPMIIGIVGMLNPSDPEEWVAKFFLMSRWKAGYESVECRQRHLPYQTSPWKLSFQSHISLFPLQATRKLLCFRIRHKLDSKMYPMAFGAGPELAPPRHFLPGVRCRYSCTSCSSLVRWWAAQEWRSKQVTVAPDGHMSRIIWVRMVWRKVGGASRPMLTLIRWQVRTVCGSKGGSMKE